MHMQVYIRYIMYQKSPQCPILKIHRQLRLSIHVAVMDPKYCHNALNNLNHGNSKPNSIRERYVHSNYTNFI